jgi:signal transduction histidine kinase/DNA-binding response OmpR family regulator
MGADNYVVGKTMGEYMAQQLKGHGTVMEIRGLAGSSPAIVRHRGFVAALSHYPGIKLLDSQNSDWTERGGEQAMTRFLKNHETVDAVFGQNDRMAIGARKVLLSQRPESRTFFVGIDALPTPGGGIEQVRDGNLLASYIYPTRGDELLQLAMNILQKKPYKKDNLLQSAIVTKDNAEVLLMQADELRKQNEKLELLHENVNHFLVQYSSQKVYLALTSIILVLVLISFFSFYRYYLMRRRVAEETQNAKLVFFTNVSHELRTPLTLISAPIDQLSKSDGLGEKERKLLRVAKRNVDVMLQLVNQILDFRKVQNGKMDLQYKSFDLVVNLRDVLNVFLPHAQHKGQQLKIEAPDTLPVISDPLKIERIVANLLSNALKFTPEGGEIVLRVFPSEGGFRIEVKDTGVGIPTDKRKAIFDRFYQVTPESGIGTGVGLSLVKALVELMHGSVSVSSVSPHGACFSVYLPMGKAENVKEADLMEPEVTYAASIEEKDFEEHELLQEQKASAITSVNHDLRPYALVVDDNGGIRSVLMKLLENDYRVKTAADGKEALNIAMSEVPDIIVSDVMMPVMDGLELCKRLKTEIATSHIPVILLTARTMDEQRINAYNCGADAYITKPFDSEMLKARMHNLIESRKHLKALFGNADVEQDKAMSSDKDFAERFREIIQQNLGDSDITVEQLGEKMGLSRVQLYRKVKAMTGHSPVEMLREARLKRADRMLATTDCTVAEIAYEVGFSSPSYFAKCYKDYFGRSPKDK